jgi:hypothetical protein
MKASTAASTTQPSELLLLPPPLLPLSLLLLPLSLLLLPLSLLLLPLSLLPPLPSQVSLACCCPLSIASHCLLGMAASKQRCMHSAWPSEVPARLPACLPACSQVQQAAPAAQRHV